MSKVTHRVLEVLPSYCIQRKPRKGKRPAFIPFESSYPGAQKVYGDTSTRDLELPKLLLPLREAAHRTPQIAI